LPIKPPLDCMKKFLFLLTSALFFITSNLNAQSPTPEYGIISDEEKKLKECPFDKEAEAVILLDEGDSNYDDQYHLITKRRIRIKILNQRGIERANITIPFYSKDQFEFITNIEGFTYTENENFSYLNKKSVYTEKKNDRVSYIKFALPNVKTGSIIEYRYQSQMKHYGGLSDWQFQSDIPTLRSSYLLQIIPGAEFSYLVNKKNNYPIVIKPLPGDGQIYFEMNNIPGLLFEPYMDAVKDYMQRVEFQLAGYTSEFGSFQKVYQTWKNISYELATDRDLGNAIKKSLSIPIDLKLSVESKMTLLEKIKTIYDYVKNNFQWNDINSKFVSDGLKKAWDARSGTSGEINLILINLLQSFNIESYPLLVAERDFGRVDPDFPLIDRFNKTVAYLEVDGKKYILDATQTFCPFGLIPYPLLNTYALIISKKNDKLIKLASTDEVYKNNVLVQMDLAANGKLNGEATIRSDSYAKEFYTSKIKNNEKKYITEYIEESHEGLKAIEFSYSNIDTSSTLIQSIKFTNQLNENGGFLLLPYNIFTGLSKNPFKSNERFTNINFGYPYLVSVVELIKLPDGCKTDDLPADKILKTPDNDISISRQMMRTENVLQIKLNFQQKLTLVSYDDYPTIKEFYKRMIEMLNEPVVVKLGK